MKERRIERQIFSCRLMELDSQGPEGPTLLLDFQGFKPKHSRLGFGLKVSNMPLNLLNLDIFLYIFAGKKLYK